MLIPACASGDGQNGVIKPGDALDINNDGMPDGLAVDSDGDGFADSIDLDGDGNGDGRFPGCHL